MADGFASSNQYRVVAAAGTYNQYSAFNGPARPLGTQGRYVAYQHSSEPQPGSLTHGYDAAQSYPASTPSIPLSELQFARAQPDTAAGLASVAPQPLPRPGAPIDQNTEIPPVLSASPRVNGDGLEEISLDSASSVVMG